MIRRVGLAVLGVLVVVSVTPAADPWHLSGWQARAVVEIQTPSTEAGVDTAGVRILCQGKAKPDGSDYRVLDAAGKPVPFQLLFHDAERYSLLSFRAADPKQRYFVYFGNPKAERSGEQVIVNPAPGAGPPKAAWVPKYGLMLETIQRPEGDNPRSVAEMTKLIEGSKTKYGARYQRRVADGYNSFGPSDYYISIYRGWINIPKAGKYQFCTVSNEASFSFLDGKELIHWPGRHTVDRGARGEVNAAVDLTAGLHYLEYYHEEVTLEQMAYLGWRPAADAGPLRRSPTASSRPRMRAWRPATRIAKERGRSSSRSSPIRFGRQSERKDNGHAAGFRRRRMRRSRRTSRFNGISATARKPRAPRSSMCTCPWASALSR